MKAGAFVMSVSPGGPYSTSLQPDYLGETRNSKVKLWICEGPRKSHLSGTSWFLAEGNANVLCETGSPRWALRTPIDETHTHTHTPNNQKNQNKLDYTKPNNIKPFLSQNENLKCQT